MPFLGILGVEEDPMGWGTDVSLVTPFLPPGGRIESLEGVGHFVHIERPDDVAAMVLDFLAVPA
jgi:pimeloyl-ACP methyl ester carboxylesterase